MKRRVYVPVLLMSMMLGSMSWADEGQAAREAGTKNASFWMTQKLRFSQNIFAGLATADFDAIAANAQSMRALNKVEAFVRRNPPSYRTQLKAFQFANEELIRTAQQDNLDGAAMAFTQMTISCVNCHKQLRAADQERNRQRSR